MTPINQRREEAEREHKWKQNYLFSQSSWFECDVCPEKKFWCGKNDHKKPEDCTTYEACLGEETNEMRKKSEKIMKKYL